MLTHRVKYLITEYGVKPDDILVITFTKAAAVEMQKRFEALMDRKLPVTFGTFHSVFFRILRQAYGYTVDNIIKDDYRRQLLTDAVNRCHMEVEDSGDFFHQLEGEISRVKGDGLDIEVYHSTKFPAQEFKDVYRLYTDALKRSGLLDFDDMLLMTRELLQDRPDLLAAWQRRYRYILIDEFQDINRIQYEVIRRLALPENNLFIVGDDDQSIYGFRGSRPELMLNFKKDYPEAQEVILDANFRSTAHIVTAAGQVIVHNGTRFAKKIHTTNEEGNPVDIVEFPDHTAQLDRIVQELRTLSGTMPLSEVAVLYRTNGIAEPLVRRLIEANIPFALREGVPNLFEHWIAKDFISYMTLALGGRKRADFLRIANKPVRYIGRDYLTEPEIDLVTLERYYDEKPWMAERVHKLASDLKLMGGMNPYAAMNFLRKGVGYDDYLKQYAEDHEIEAQELYDTAEEVMESARGKRCIADWFDYIGDYTRELRATNRRKGTENKEEAVTLTTMHSSKGLEYDTVFIMDANEGICPHRKSVFPDQIEEERRMFYVAMTRAKKQLHIYYARQKYNRKTQASRFIGEIMEKPLKS